MAAGSFGVMPSSAASPTDAERNARELLARWNAQHALTPKATARVAAESAPMQTSVTIPAQNNPAPSEQNNHERPRRKRRVDRLETVRSLREPSPLVNPPLEIARPANWTSAVGQMCAYFGIGLITCGTALVVWGYFGGALNLAPTGWLITTIGQMFLFLGVVTLISGGMEQTAAEVAARIETLGIRLIRIESLQHELAGPHLRRKSKNERRESRDNQQEAA